MDDEKFWSENWDKSLPLQVDIAKKYTFVWKILIEPAPSFTLTPIFFKIFDANFNLGLSFLFNSSNFLKLEIPDAFDANKKIIKNSSIALLLSSTGQFIDFNLFWLFTLISAHQN